ncbi:MAG: molybdopterin molybdotransferase MoeA [Patescibacteria group bacterium]
MISVEDAEKLVLSQSRDYGVDNIPLGEALGRILAEPVIADRDFPPANRATMDGVAINYRSFSKGQRMFSVKAVQPAGNKTVSISKPDQCIEIMTGAILDNTVDTVIRIEDVDLRNGHALITTDNITRGQFIHRRGVDKKRGDQVATAGSAITPTTIAVLASAGYSSVKVRKLPDIIIMTTGDELVGIDQKPRDYQLRRSNDWAIRSVLESLMIKTDTLHLPDNEQIIRQAISESLKKYDVVLLSGGVSKGKYDYVQSCLDSLAVKKIFHGVSQRPGKPFWFGVSGSKLVFAFPGNPVSSLLCLYRYFVPWLTKSLGEMNKQQVNAILDESLPSNELLTQFVPANLSIDEFGQLCAAPIANNGSGDFISLVKADAFVELPPSKSINQKGSPYRAWPFEHIA